jgi:hypothetical protein
MDRSHRPHTLAVRLAVAQERMVYLLASGLLLSGGLWLLLEHFVRVELEFGPERHWLQPWLLKAHGMVAALALWGFGVLWAVHVRRAWSLGRHRLSGGTMFAIAAWLAVSGVLLYYAGSDALRRWLSLLHWGVGLAAALALTLHVTTARQRRPRRAPDAP